MDSTLFLVQKSWYYLAMRVPSQTFNRQYWADRRHAPAITQGARGVTTDDDLVLPWVLCKKGAAYDHPDGAYTTLLATPTATSTDRPVTTAAPPEDL